MFLKLILKSYVLPVVLAGILCYIEKRLDLIEVQIDNINEVMKSALTVSSILFGFFGTMLGQLINVKSKSESNNENIVTMFFENVNVYEIRFVMLVNIINIIIVDLLSMFIMCVNKHLLLIKFWFCIFTIFVFNLLYVYYVFVNLLLYKKGVKEIKDKMSDSEIERFKNSLNNKE